MLGLKLQIEIDGCYQILARLRRHLLELALNAAAAVHDHLAIARFAAQVFVVILFEAALTDNVAGTQAFVFELVIFELFWADLADVTEHVRERGTERVKPLRLELDAKLGKLKRMRLDPGNVGHLDIFLEHHRLKIVLLLYQVEALNDKLAIKIEAARVIVNAVVEVDRFQRLV